MEPGPDWAGAADKGWVETAAVDPATAVTDRAAARPAPLVAMVPTAIMDRSSRPRRVTGAFPSLPGPGR